MNARLNRLLRHNPPPLPPTAPAYIDQEFYESEKDGAEQRMREYDRCSKVVRQVDHAVGNTYLARKLVKEGICTAEQAEPVVRAMLERMR